MYLFLFYFELMEDEVQQKKDEWKKKNAKEEETLPFRMKDFWMVSMCRCWLHAILLGIEPSAAKIVSPQQCAWNFAGSVITCESDW